jgi:NAD(P)-dependent dehydrogenase (short-subunit alcohol dehydrogenase family)
MGQRQGAAAAYARNGAKIVAADRNLEAAEGTAAFILSEDHDALAVAADVTVLADVQRAVQGAVSRPTGASTSCATTSASRRRAGR